MSLLKSKPSSRGNIQILYTNQSKSSNRQRQKYDKASSNYSSSAVKQQQKMQLTFQKTGQKLKKNLAKEFQTFNINNQEIKKPSKQTSQEESFKKLNEEKSAKSRNQAELTTQAKSSIVKSNLGSKAKLSQYNEQQGESQKYSKIKQSLKKSREKSNKSKSPTSQVSRSRKSSPQVSPAYSKFSSQKRVFSKSKLQQYENNLKLQQKKQSETQIAKNFTKMNASSIESNPSMVRPKGMSKITKDKSQIKGQQYQIYFPQMITESQSVYPSSSHPNTGKQSQYQHHSAQGSQQNSNIAEQQDELDAEIQHSDYISENRQQSREMMDSRQREQESEGQQYNQPQSLESRGYQQLPKSYLLAMQILQTKVNQQRKTIQKLSKQVSKENTKYLQLEGHVKSLQQELQQKDGIMADKDAEIRFLKGYLNDEKQNNRQALKEIAKNVYERTISAKKENRQNSYEMTNVSMNKPKKQLFTDSIDQGNNQLSKSKHIATNPDLIDKLVQPQLLRQQQLNDSLQRQLALKEQLQKQQLIKDEMMRQQILREQQLKNELHNNQNNNKRYHYLDESRRSADRLVLGDKMNSHSMRKLGKIKIEDTEEHEAVERSLYSDGKRLRSMSTAVKLSQSKNVPSNTYRPWNTSSSEIPRFGYTHAPQSFTKTPSKLLMDPALQKHIQAKSQISSSYRYPQSHPNSSLNSHMLIHPNEGADLKNQKRNKQTVSQMRQLMRAEKQMVTLNYKLEAIEKRILQCVKTTDNENVHEKSMNQQVNQKLMLEDLQKQYAIVKKEFERKELTVKELKMKLELKM